MDWLQSYTKFYKSLHDNAKKTKTNKYHVEKELTC